MKARVTVTLKSGILDPQGKAIEGALKSLGVDGVASVRQGKVFDIEIAGNDRAKADAASKPAGSSEAPEQPRARGQDDCDHGVVAVFPAQLRHVLEVHAVDSG